MDRPKTNVIDELFINNDSFLLAMLGTESRRKFTKAVGQLGLNWQEQTVLVSLYALLKHGAVSQKQLAVFAGIDPRNLVPIIDSLEQSNMIRRTPNPTDRRGYQLQLTGQGKVMAKRIQEIRTKLERSMLANLSESEKRLLHKLLIKLWEHSDISHGFRAYKISDNEAS